MKDDSRAELVLVGGGHAHVQVIRRLAMAPLPGVRVTLVLDRPEAVYSGMVPGFVAGDLPAEALEIDVVPLARRARARVVLAPALRVDPEARRIEVEGRPSLAYDVASLDVGSGVRGEGLPGVREHALATRPIRGFVDALEARLAGARAGQASPLRVVVVGGGAAGVELACTLAARLRRAGAAAELVLLADAPDLLPGASARFARRARRELAARGVAVRCGARVERVEKDAVVLAGGERVAADLVVWATGAAPPALVRDSPLPHDPDGFVRVRATLQVDGFDDLFAAGDCAALAGHPWVPKAGVYAVRQGPVLAANLRARLRGGRLRRHRPQRDVLVLLNLGDRRALGHKWGVVAGGRAVWRAKDAIDRRFVRRFRVLRADGSPAPGFPSPEAMGMEAMECGGCAAKLDAVSLERALGRVGPGAADADVLLGLEAADDAAALRTRSGDVLLATVDGFRPFTDDPWLVGRVAAVNALSDVYAKGGRPRHALALVAVPEAEPARAEETLVQVLAGVRAALDPLGVSLVGGHTTSGPELHVALAVTGELPPGTAILRLAGARPGDALLLTKPLGTGVLLAADMQGRARGAWVQSCHAALLRPNAAAAEAARAGGARAATDVSGFGLARHLLGLLRASGASARLEVGALPALPGALPLLAAGLRSSFHAANRAAAGDAVDGGEALGASAELLFDPQTSGGLLLAVPPEHAAATLARLRAGGDAAAAHIGDVEPASAGGPRIELV